MPTRGATGRGSAASHSPAPAAHPHRAAGAAPPAGGHMPRTRATIEANLIHVAAELRAQRTGHSDSRHVDLLLADADTLLDEWLGAQP